MVKPGAIRNRLAAILTAAFADGLLSEQTLAHRLGLVFGPSIVDPDGVVGDLERRRGRRRWPPPARATAVALAGGEPVAPLVLALDWIGGGSELLLGRAPDCDVELRDDSVSRRHAQLRYRDGAWIIEDLASTNGTPSTDVAWDAAGLRRAIAWSSAASCWRSTSGCRRQCCQTRT